MEFRNPAWLQESIFALLEEHGAGYCVMSGAGLPCVLRATAPFVYVRLHGPDHHHLYAGSYSDDDLRWWADRVRECIGLVLLLRGPALVHARHNRLRKLALFRSRLFTALDFGTDLLEAVPVRIADSGRQRLLVKPSGPG